MAQVQQASGLGDANTAMTAILQHSRDVQGVFADTDEAAIGAIHALATSGMEPGRQVQVISIGASRSAFYFLITGQLSASLECNPVLGPQVYARALDALNGVTPGPTWGPSQEATFFASQGADALWTILEARKY
jgi:simple sugar transport system substrate-binding protein